MTRPTSHELVVRLWMVIAAVVVLGSFALALLLAGCARKSQIPEGIIPVTHGGPGVAMTGRCVNSNTGVTLPDDTACEGRDAPTCITDSAPGKFVPCKGRELEWDP
jgi:hypothetical protein